MIELDVLEYCLDNFIFVYLVIIVTRFLNNEFHERFYFRDLLYAILIGIIVFMFDSFGLIIWFSLTLLYQNIHYKKLNYNFLNNRLVALMVVTISNTFSVCMEPIVKFFFKSIFGLNISNSSLTYLYIVIYILLTIVFLILFYKKRELLLFLIDKIIKLKLESKIFQILLFLFVSMIIIIGLSQFFRITYLMKIPIVIVFLIFIILTVFQVIFFIQSFSYRQETESKMIQNEQLTEYLNTMEQQYSDLRQFKHDYKNMLLALEGFADGDNQGSFRKYYQQLLNQEPINRSLNKLTIDKIEFICNEPVRGLIIEKFFSAQKSGVEVQLEVSNKIKINNSDILSIVRILGILLDNAIEQTMKESKKEITCSFINSDKLTEITISNPASNLDNVPTNKLFQKGYSTKDGHMGVGLTNVQKLVGKNDSLYLETNLNNHYFNITLILEGEI